MKKKREKEKKVRRIIPDGVKIIPYLFAPVLACGVISLYLFKTTQPDLVYIYLRIGFVGGTVGAFVEFVVHCICCLIKRDSSTSRAILSVPVIVFLILLYSIWRTNLAVSSNQVSYVGWWGSLTGSATVFVLYLILMRIYRSEGEKKGDDTKE